MKLLLTSNGIANKSILESLLHLVGKNKEEIKIGFIPTAANVEEGNKDWFIQQITDLQKFGFPYIDIVDISAPDVDWKTRLNQVDVIYVGGGNTFHLLNQVRRSGFDSWLKESIENKVYVGSSAGSILVTPSIGVSTIEPGDPNLSEITDFTGLKLVPFEISPHTPDLVKPENNDEYVKGIVNEFYEIDNQTAIEVIDKTINIITEGVWRKIK